jgi:hypothetical protein
MGDINGLTCAKRIRKGEREREKWRLTVRYNGGSQNQWAILMG